MYLSCCLITLSNNNNPYRAYIENLLSFSTEAKNSQLSSILWPRNTSGQFHILGEANIGYINVTDWQLKAKKIDMYGRLNLDLSFQNCY